MKIALLGAGGMLATDVAHEARERGMKISEVFERDCDITDAVQCRDMLRRQRPELVINCAAYTNVDGAESNRDAAFAVNAQGAANVARACAEISARCIYISTDYVFDGEKPEPYVEDDLPHPLGSYGASKLEGEKLTLSGATDSAVIRTSWLYGSAGRNFVSTMLRLAGERDQLRVVSDQVGAPTYTRDLARNVVAVAASELCGILHVTNSGACSWFQFAREIFALAGYDPERVVPISSAEYVAAALRPANSRLASTPLPGNVALPLPHWTDALRRYLSEIGKLA